MKFSYSWLQSYFKIKLPSPVKLAELLSDHFANVEEVKKDGQDFVLDIEVRPNRAADCFGHWGVAREIAAILKIPLNLPRTATKETGEENASHFVSIRVQTPSACPRYTAFVIQGVKVGPSPAWLRKRLEVCGLQSINNIVDVANYVMLETNQPLHAFDWEKIFSLGEKKTILVRFARKGEKLPALDGKTYELAPDVLVIADIKIPLAVAGIKGGKSSGIDRKTKTIVLEGANFHPLIVRRGSQRLKLRTDASLRFEHGLDPGLTEPALSRAAGLITELAGGKVAPGHVDIYSVKRKPKKIKLEIALVNDLLGVKVSQKEAKRALESLGFKTRLMPYSLLVEAPIGRLDISFPEDLVEEIGRLVGYKNIPDIAPTITLSPPLENQEIYREELARDALAKAGFSEVWNYSFLSNEARNAFNFKTEELVELENPLDQNRPYLVPSLLPNLLNNLSLNSANFEIIKIFELGKVFYRKIRQGLKEERRLAAVVHGESEQGFWELKGALEFLFKEAGIKALIWRLAKKSDLCEKGKCFEIFAYQEKLGFLGELKASVAASLDVKDPVWLAEINFEKLLRLFSEDKTYQPLVRNPAAKRDLALLVPDSVRSSQIKTTIESAKIPHLVKTELFDSYRGKELPAGKKSFAFHFFFQSPERTLSTKEIDEAVGKIISVVKTKNWAVRK
jgi:phenylalanyl-tRNA synthetase beta chain